MFPNLRREAASMIAAIWIGLILGVSFYAAPIKFTAAGVSLEQLLAVGQVTFQGFTWVELAAFALLLASLTQLSRNVAICMTLLFILLLIQKFVVLPILDTALNQTVAGEPAGGNNLHFVYGLIDCVKMAVLFSLSLLLRAAGNARQSSGVPVLQ